jgi:hypothetical protein
VASTKDYKLTFSDDNDMSLTLYVDASYNSYPDAKSHYGYCIMLGKTNAPFHSKSAKMRLQTQSSTESEYVALSHSVNELYYLHRLLDDLGYPQKPTVIHEDNMSAIHMIYSDELNHKTTKHINPKYHNVRQAITDLLIEVIHIDTTEQIADLFTKSLPINQHVYLTDKLLNSTQEK